MTFVILYLALGVINTLVRLWFIIRYKIGCDQGIRWKVFFLTEFIIEQILIWPINLIVSIWYDIKRRRNWLWANEFMKSYYSIICEEDDD
jgi:hypothetical protein